MLRSSLGLLGPLSLPAPVLELGMPSSQSKRPRFAADEDVKLVDLKAGERLSHRRTFNAKFLGRNTGSLQVHYSTRLKEKIIHHEKGDTE
jgi:hypothetical protein